MAAISRTLLPSSSDSRDHSALFTRERTLCPRTANSSSEPPVTSTIKARINIPRAGSEAKACTDTSTPERTEEGAQQAQREGADGQQQRPRLKAGALFGDRQRVQQGGARQPRHKGGVLHRVPEPPAAPAQLVVGPRRAEHDTQRQEHPRRQRPRAGKTGERAVQTPAQQRGDGKGEGHREADIAHVQQRRVENQPRVLQQRVQVTPLHRKGRQRAGERAGGEQDEQQKTGADHPHHRQHPGHDIRRHRPAEHRHRRGPAAQQQHPQQQRALVRPQVAATRYHTGSCVFELPAT